jgi:hypothetical protein
MGNELATGLSATRGAPNSSDSTFVWDVVEQVNNLVVKVSYGGGTDTSNIGTATIPVGSTNPIQITPAPNPAISVIGSVTAAWGNNNKSYVVTFSGQMVRPNVNNIISSDQNGAASDNYPVIVYAYLS